MLFRWRGTIPLQKLLYAKTSVRVTAGRTDPTSTPKIERNALSTQTFIAVLKTNKEGSNENESNQRRTLFRLCPPQASRQAGCGSLAMRAPIAKAQQHEQEEATTNKDWGGEMVLRIRTFNRQRKSLATI